MLGQTTTTTVSPKCQEQPIIFDYENPSAFELLITESGNQRPESHSEDALLGSNSSVSVSAGPVYLELIPRTTPHENILLMDVSATVTCADGYSMTMKNHNGTTVSSETVIKTIYVEVDD